MQWFAEEGVADEAARTGDAAPDAGEQENFAALIWAGTRRTSTPEYRRSWMDGCGACGRRMHGFGRIRSSGGSGPVRR